MGAIYDAASQGDLKTFKKLIEANAALVNEKDAYGSSPLYGAAKNGHLHIVRYMVEELGISLKDKMHNQPDNGESPLDVAIRFGRLPVVRYLHDEKDVQPREITHEEDNIVYGAAWSGFLEMLRYWVDEKGLSPHIKNKWGVTPLHKAAQAGWVHVIRYLVDEKKVPFNEKNHWGVTPLQEAIKSYVALDTRKFEVMRFFVEEKNMSIEDNIEDHDVKVTVVRLAQRQLHEAKDAEKLSAFLKKAGLSDEKYNTPLSTAVSSRRLMILSKTKTDVSSDTSNNGVQTEKSISPAGPSASASSSSGQMNRKNLTERPVFLQSKSNTQHVAFKTEPADGVMIEGLTVSLDLTSIPADKKISINELMETFSENCIKDDDIMRNNRTKMIIALRLPTNALVVRLVEKLSAVLKPGMRITHNQ